MATEKRLIDANALKDALRTNDGARALGHSVRRLFCVDEIIDSLPTVDAVEVVHPQWDTVFYERYGTIASYSHICPRCKYFYRDLKFKGHNYCPNCGAKMDLDDGHD